MSKVLLEQMSYRGPESKKIEKETKKLIEQMSDFLSLSSEEIDNDSIEDQETEEVPMAVMDINIKANENQAQL